MPNQYDKIVKEIMDSVYMAFSKKIIDADFSSAEELSTELHKTREKKTDFLRKIIYPNPGYFLLMNQNSIKSNSNSGLRRSSI
jgi:hypothetical protein